MIPMAFACSWCLFTIFGPGKIIGTNNLEVSKVGPNGSYILSYLGQNFTPVHLQVTKVGESKRPWVKYAPSPSSASPTTSCLKRSAEELDSSLEVSSFSFSLEVLDTVDGDKYSFDYFLCRKGV